MNVYSLMKQIRLLLNTCTGNCFVLNDFKISQNCDFVNYIQYLGLLKKEVCPKKSAKVKT